MFDVGFWEICLIGMIALIVIGPERLPRVARVTGMWIGKIRGMVKTVKHDIDEQLRLEELKQSMQSNIPDPLDDLKTELKESGEEIKNLDKPAATPDKSSSENP